MEPKIVYPVPRDQNHIHRTLRSIARILFLAGALSCVIVNLCVKGKPCAVVVVWSLYIAWKLFFSVKSVEFSFFSHFIRVFVYVLILIWLIDHFLSTGWSKTVLPIVLFGMLLVMFVIFFATYSKREKHLLSIMILGIVSVISAPYFISFPVKNWIAFSFSAASIALFLVLLFISRKLVLGELKARFIVREKRV